MSSSGRKLTRLPGYDYASPGAYYITICVKGSRPPLAEMANDCVCLNGAGMLVDFCWHDLVNHYHNVLTDKYIIMPDHFHGILHIRTPEPGLKQYGLPEIIRGFKTFSSRRINEKFPDLMFMWQKSYYDRIIRNDAELSRIREYIINNPMALQFKKHA